MSSQTTYYPTIFPYVLPMAFSTERKINRMVLFSEIFDKHLFLTQFFYEIKAQ